jgi:hypothetical protein
MNVTREIKDTLALQNPQEKVGKLEQLSDVFEYGCGLSEEDVIEGTRLLLAAILREKDQSVKDQLFYALYTSVVHQDIGDRIDWDALVDILPSLNKSQLEEALGVLGLSGQERYLHVLDEYTHNADPEIREWALDAIREIKYRLAHASDPTMIQQHKRWNLFARELEEVLNAHGLRLGHLDDRVGIHREKIRRLQQSLLMPKSFPVLNSEEMELLIQTFNLSEEERTRLRAALLATAIERMLMDRIDQDNALHASEQIQTILRDTLLAQLEQEEGDIAWKEYDAWASWQLSRS